MDSSSGHNQEMRTSSEQSMNNMAGPGTGAGPAKGGPGERKPRPAGDQQALKCPRCESANTKFCYYNNYSLTQPRYFCKSCRRYWTKGGTLRNVPVGGGCRKNRRPSSSSSSSSAKRAPHDHLLAAATTNSATGSFPILPPPPPPLLLPPAYDQNDLTLAFSRLQNEQQLCSMFGNASSGFLDALKTGFLDSSSSTLSHHNSNGTVNYYGYNLNNSGNNTTYDNDDDDNNDRIALEDHRQTMVKNELCSGSYNNASIMRSSSDTNNDQNRVLWGLPWQLNGSLDHNNINGNMVDFDASNTTSSTGREIWNGFAPSNWHGLLNTTPLM